MKIVVKDPRFGEKYKVVPTSEMVKQWGVSRFLPKEGIEAVHNEFYHSRYLEGAIQLYEVKEIEVQEKESE